MKLKICYQADNLNGGNSINQIYIFIYISDKPYFNEVNIQYLVYHRIFKSILVDVYVNLKVQIWISGLYTLGQGYN